VLASIIRKEVITLPNLNTTDVLTDNQLGYLASSLPKPKARTGRPGYSNTELLPGILKVLRSGMRWRDLDRKNFPSGVTHWRRLRFWGLKFGLKVTWEGILKKLHKSNKLNLNIVSIDGSLVPSFGFSDTTGYSGKYKKTGTKISTLVDFLGTPFNVVFASGNTHDMPLAVPTIINNVVGKPGIILADKGYDSDKLRLKLKESGINSNIAVRNSGRRKDKIKYNIPLGKLRFKIERTNAWIKSFRRLHFRFDVTFASFQALTYLALIVICLRKLIS
jgi:transposase